MAGRNQERRRARAPGRLAENVRVALIVREMDLEEVDLIIDYFHGSTPEHLELLGVDPTRLPSRERWRERYAGEYEQAVYDRSTLLVVWELDDVPVGFSTADK